MTQDQQAARLARVIAGIENMDGTPGPRAGQWPPPQPDDEPSKPRLYGWRAIALPAVTWTICALALWGAIDIARRLL